MTIRRRSLSEAADAGDITLALSPTQLTLVAMGLYILLRILRGLRA